MGSVFGLGDFKSFSPDIPKERKKINKNRIWVHLEPKCFDNQSDIRSFADHLVSKYECITFREDRFQTFYRHYTSPNDTVWSLWLDRNHHHHSNLKCLDEKIRLPRNIASECIASVQYEPLEHVMQQPTCKVHGTSGQLDLWSLDWLDGVFDQLYRYPDYAERTNVEAIILDTDVDEYHVEFADNNPNDLNDYFNGSPYGPSTSQDHGTHVAGTVVGHDVGGSWGVKLNYYAVCQLGGSCAWSDIERGYNWAIDYMNAQPSGTRFVINYSVGGARSSSNEYDYNQWGIRIQAAGGIWVTSAGNSNANSCNFAPAFSQYAVTVGAYDINTQAAWFSNYGECNDVWGPGVLVESAAPGGGYTKMSGTSMSSPNIASIVAKLLKRDSSLDTERIKVYMMTNARTVYDGSLVMNQAYLNCDYD